MIKKDIQLRVVEWILVLELLILDCDVEPVMENSKNVLVTLDTLNLVAQHCIYHISKQFMFSYKQHVKNVVEFFLMMRIFRNIKEKLTSSKKWVKMILFQKSLNLPVLVQRMLKNVHIVKQN